MGPTGGDALRLNELEKAVEVQIPRLQWKQVRSDQSLDFAGFEAAPSDPYTQVFLSPVTEKGRLALLKIRENNNPQAIEPAKVLVLMESFTRERARGNY